MVWERLEGDPRSLRRGNLSGLCYQYLSRGDGLLHQGRPSLQAAEWQASFRIVDRYFCSAMAQTDPNRRYLIAGTSLGLIDDSFPLELPPMA